MVRLLAFGDSLTAGYHRSGAAFAPWAPVLRDQLGVAAVDHIGLSGMTAAQMVRFADQEVVTDVVPRQWPGFRTQLRTHKYEVVLIMCGTNDLADYEPSARIVEHIAALHSMAHEAGARSVAMTIPESKAALHVDWLGQARRATNEAIMSWARAQPVEKVHLVDAAALVPFTEAVQPRLWEFDGLHMSKAGYECFGRRLAPLIQQFTLGVSPPLPSEIKASVNTTDCSPRSLKQ